MIKFWCIFIWVVVLASCNPDNVLTYKWSKRYYTERSIIEKDSPLVLYQSVFYDRPHVIDEEFGYELSLAFTGTAKVNTKRKINLEYDTTLIKSSYGIFSIWNWGNERNSVAGYIEILNVHDNKIKIKEHIIIDDHRRKERRRFIGTRTFKRR